MSDKEAYEKIFVDYGWALAGPLEFTGKCKKVNSQGEVNEFMQVQRRVFGLPLYKSWVNKSDIRWFDKTTVEYYDCGDKNG